MFRRNKRSVGQAIVREAEQYFSELGLKSIEAFSRRYYCNSDPTLPDRWDHVGAILGHCGYSVTLHGLFMHLPDYRADRPAPPCSGLDYTVEPFTPERKPHDPQFKSERPGTLLHLRLDGGWVGSIKNCALSIFLGGEEGRTSTRCGMSTGLE